jgi:hypothetical protein
LGLYPTELRAGSQIRQTLPGRVAPAPTQSPLMLQPAQGLQPGEPATHPVEPASPPEFAASDPGVSTPPASDADAAASAVDEFDLRVGRPPSAGFSASRLRWSMLQAGSAITRDASSRLCMSSNPQF